MNVPHGHELARSGDEAGAGGGFDPRRGATGPEQFASVAAQGEDAGGVDGDAELVVVARDNENFTLGGVFPVRGQHGVGSGDGRRRDGQWGGCREQGQAEHRAKRQKTE